MHSTLLATLVVCLLAAVYGRPVVRNIRTNSEFHKLLKHHKEVTGLPVVIDYYSDGCGPCRMIAPHYTRLAKQYKDKVVFAKVDVNHNRETSGAQYIRSMPTFQFYSHGKKVHQFSGGDVNQLTQWAQKLSRDAERDNVKITMENLVAFYTKHAPDKATDQVALAKVMEKAGGERGGPGHRKLAQALKKKYGEAPVLEKRYIPGATDSTKSKAETASKPTKKSGDPAKPNLHLATLDQLKEELAKRVEAEEAAREEDADDAEDDDAEGGDHFISWTPSANGFAERVVIIGSGPAGLTAAIYAARAGLRPVVVAPPSGGQLQGKGVLVENYPAVLGATGPHVVFEMMKQAARFGTTFHDELVERVDFTARPFKVFTNTTTLSSHSVIISTGADSRWLDVPGEYKYRGGGVSSCATCDGFLYKDRPVVVVGGGDAAMDDALHLARTSSKVTIVHRRGEFRASHILAQRVLNHEKIEVLWNTTVQEFVGEEHAGDPSNIDPNAVQGGEDVNLENADHAPATLTHVVVKTNGVEQAERLPCDGAFVAIGHDPNTKIFADLVEMDKDGYIVVKSNHGTKTSLEGVFAAGDVADKVYRQAVTSAGSGAMAAMDAEHWLDAQGIKDEEAIYEAELMRELMEEFQKPRV